MANPVRVWTGTAWQDLALVGPTGPQGPAGANGATGAQGPPGANGTDGAAATAAHALLVSPHPEQGLAPTRWGGLWAYGGVSTATRVPGSLMASRTVLATAIDTVAIEVATAGAATVVVAAYADVAGAPGAKLVQSASIDGSTTGVKQVALAVPAGPVWLATQNTGGANVTLRAPLGLNPYLPGTLVPGPVGGTFNGWQSAVVQGATVPDPFPTLIYNGWSGVMYLRGA